MGILLIADSPNALSRSAALLAVAGSELGRLGFAPQTLNLRDLPAEALLLAQTEHAAVKAAVRQATEARAIVIATPIYKAAYSGLLKVFLDLLPPEALRRKVVLPMATGGTAAHLLALDYALQPVLSSLGARDVLDAVFASDAQVSPRDDGTYVFDADIRRRVDSATRALGTRLVDVPLAPGARPAVAHAVPERCSA
jgi:FMN reductase